MNFVKIFQVWKTFLIFCLYQYVLCRRGNKHFDVQLWLIMPVHFLSKDGKDAAYEEKNWWKSVYFPLDSAFSLYS